MKSRIFRRPAGAAVLLIALLGGCGDGDETATADPGESTTVTGATAPTGGQTAQQPASPPQPPQNPPLELEVDLSERRLHVIENGERVESHPVAVGSEEWPTPTGSWTINQVVWNPRWIPPKEEEWAEDEEVKEPGDPENPLGRAQLVYNPPNTIHGTNEPESLGKAVSHGSIRASNEVVQDLARRVMEVGGAGKDESWYRSARENPTERRDVGIPNGVPIRVVP